MLVICQGKPALTQQLTVLQGKVRRMRESPFNKASGLAKRQPAKSRMAPALASPEQGADSEEEVPTCMHLVRCPSQLDA